MVKPGTPSFVGARLTEAREARGLSVAALAELVDTRRETIYQIEAGKITPGPAVYEQLQQKLRIPAAFFLDPVEAAEPEGQVLFRSLKSATKSARVRAGRRLQWLERITRFVQTYVDLPAFDIPDYGFPSDPSRIGDDEIEFAACDLRDRWKLGQGPISNAAWLLENHGIITTREDLVAAELDAAYLRRESNTFVILGADKGTAVRSRLDACHELGHVVVHPRCPTPTSEKDPRHKIMEDQAFRFAAAFLLPAESFGRDIRLGTIDEFLSLKPKWLVAVAAMIVHANRLGLVSEAQYDRLWKQYNAPARRWKRKEPFDDEWQPEQPVLLRRSFELLLSERVLSVDGILNEIRLPATDIEDLAGLPRGTISDGAIPIAFRDRPGSTREALANIVPFDRGTHNEASFERLKRG